MRHLVSSIAGRFFTVEPPGKPKNTGVIAYPFPGDLPDPGIELASPAWLGDSSPAELPGNMPLHRTSLQMRVQY